MEPKYKIGDTVWFPHVDRNTCVTKPCPVCFGKLKVTLILGDDTAVELPCGYCGHGYDGPRGYVEEYEYVAACRAVTIAGMEMNVTGEGMKCRYNANGFIYNEGDLFATKEKAEKDCERRAAEMKHEMETKAHYLKADKMKSYSWNAGYHMREAKHCRDRIAYHEHMAVLCKAKSKQGVRDELR